MRTLLCLALALASQRACFAQPDSVVNSPHNLSASGPGRVRATGENEVCIFCHAPHNATPIQPLWNRAMPQGSYSIYSSRALNASPGQPTGSSKMCLSCHDGTIALGSVVSRDQPIMMSGGVTTMPAGHSNIGTDLRDDHPVSFKFGASLLTRDPKLKPPAALPHEVRLDASGELQCTSCHDAHSNALGSFLVMRNADSGLCKSCHNMGETTIDAHAQCSTCHQPHTAPSGPYLLRRSTISQTCLSCHDGSVVGAPSVMNDVRKSSTHDTNSPVDPPGAESDHVSCADCHEPHTMGRGGTARTTGLHPSFGRIGGMSGSGSVLTTATNEFEVCFKCHGDTGSSRPFVSRQVQAVGVRQQFSPSAVSYHPVESTGKNTNVPSLLPGWSVGSRVTCTDCHGSDGALPAIGAAKRGMHGSSFAPNLVARYDVDDYTSESAQAYALCYQCHDRSNILSDRSFAGHKLHIVDQRAPCASCHDAHGVPSSGGTSRGNSKLINFATSMVFPDRVTGRLEYIDQGTSRQQCFLSCHGVNHSPATYPQGGLGVMPGAIKRPGR